MRFLIALLLCFGIAGCGPDPGNWKKHSVIYSPDFSLFADNPKSVTVVWAEIEDLNQAQNAANVYINDHRSSVGHFTADQVKEWTALQLKPLRLTESPSEIQLIGASSFWRDRPPKQKDDGLRAFARDLGADTVIVGFRHAGKRDGWKSYPISTYSSAMIYSPYSGNYYFGSGRSTTWLPVPVKIDVYDTKAVYLRHTTPAENEAFEKFLNARAALPR